MKKNCNSPKNRQAGYSLIQIAIGMVVLGIFIAAAGRSYVIYTKNEQIMTTQQRVQEMVTAIQGYRQLYGRYPCPARMDVNSADPSYGHESDCTDDSISVGDCVLGLCIETAIDGTNYTVTNGTNITTADRAAALADRRVRLGAIPFRLLQIDEKKTYDSYGNRLLYAMTESMADEGAFRELNGAIHVVNAQGESLIDPPGSVPFLIVSPGPNQLGAYSFNGSQISECPDTVLDGENCRNFDPLAVITPPTLANPPLSIFVSDYRMDITAANSFDDIIEYFADSSNPLWKRTPANIENIEALVQQSVGIDAMAQPADALEIPQGSINYDHDNNAGSATINQRGGLRVVNPTNTVQARLICDLNGANCFDPRRLGGTVAQGMSCPPNQYMIGIEGGGTNGQARCADVQAYCNNAATPVLLGFNQLSGAPICGAIPLSSCNAGVQLCSGMPLAVDRRNSNNPPITNPIVLVGTHGQIKLATDTASYALNQRRANFVCNNGVWQYSSGETGFCTCNTPPLPTQTVNIPCPGLSPSGNAATIDQTWDATNCQWNNVNGSQNYAACVCAGPYGAPPGTLPPLCGPGTNSGSVDRVWNFNNAPNICNWEPADTNNCVCSPAAATPPAAAVGDEYTGTTGTACSLVGMPGHTGNAFPVYKFTSVPGLTCGWVFDRWDTSACVCDTVTEFFHHNTTPSPCNLACETQLTPEQYYFKYIVVAGACVPDTPYKKTDATCQNINFYWRGGTTPVGPSLNNKAGKPAVDEACTCAQKATSTTCWKEIPTDPGNYNFFPCTCNL